MSGHIVAMGGGGFYADPESPLDEFVLSLSPQPRPRVCLVPTPSGDSDPAIAAFFEAFSRRECEPSCLRLFGVPDDPVGRLSTQDVIYVCGGNTANALAIWRIHGIDAALRDAWEHLYGDFCAGSITAIAVENEKVASSGNLGVTVPQLTSFGVDALARVYALSLTGDVYRLDPKASATRP